MVLTLDGFDQAEMTALRAIWTEEPAMSPKLDSFTRAYIITALWSTMDDEGEPMDQNFDESDLAPETLERFIADCAKFQADNAALIEAAIETGNVKAGPDFNEYDRAAHDFWLTRCGHGAGFWDGDWPEPYATQLTAAAEAFGNVDLYVGDDGKLYV